MVNWGLSRHQLVKDGNEALAVSSVQKVARCSEAMEGKGETMYSSLPLKTVRFYQAIFGSLGTLAWRIKEARLPWAMAGDQQ